MGCGQMAKLKSQEPAWRDLSALSLHYETQPAPTRLAWHLHRAPGWLHALSALGMFIVELLAP